MRIKRLAAAVAIGFWLALGGASSVPAQEAAAAQQPSAEEQEKAKKALEEKALALLEQVISEGQALKLPENRIRIQITAGELLWTRSEGRARAFFADAAAGITEMMRQVDANDRRFFNQLRVPSQLRQELVLTVGRYDGTLAYQIFNTTRAPEPAAAANNGRVVSRMGDMDANLERQLLALIAQTDPQMAVRNADEMLDKGQYSNALARVLSQLQSKDQEAAKKLSERMVKRLQSENLLANRDAASLALNLLQPGPRLAENASSEQPSAAQPAVTINAPGNSGRPPVLSQASYRDLLDSLVSAALKASPAQNQRGAGAGRAQRAQRMQRGGQNNQRPNSPPSPPTAQQNEQANAQWLLRGMQTLLPQIQQHLPTRLQAVQQKLAETGIGTDERRAFTQMLGNLQGANSEALVAAAATAPPGMQDRLYQQAAMRALSEGNPERARQIANEQLESPQRESVIRSIELQQLARSAGDERIEEMRQSISQMGSNEERVRTLLQLAETARKNNNQKLALQLLDEAQGLVSKRASNYQQFDAQLRVARAYAAIDPARSFELLAPGINQLNELLPAAATLSGFEVNVFRDGELPLQGGSMLTNMVNRYAQELAALSKIDFERAQTEADKFIYSEPRIMTRLAIVKGVLGAEQSHNAPGDFGGPFFGPNTPFARRP